MNSALATVGKTVNLLTVLVITLLNYFYGWFNFKTILLIQLLFGSLYIFFYCREYLNASVKASLPVERISYFTASFYMFKILKAGVFLMFGGMLLTAGGRIIYLAPICFIISVTELVVMLLMKRKQLCYVSFFANYLIISGVKFNKLFCHQIKQTEYRHDIFHFVNNDNSVLQINIEYIEEKDKFMKLMMDWIKKNKVNISAESEAKLFN